jgi:hypothetical protein
MPPPEPPPIPVKYRNVPPTPPPAESETIPAAATSPASKPPALSMSHDVKQGVEHLRSEREALTKERKDALEELIRDGAGPAERAELRHKITALVARLAANPPARLTSANGEKATPLALPQLPQDLKPADPIGLGRVLFRAKDYEAVLRTFRLLDLEAMNREDRAFVQYLSASCQRLLGKPSEAAALYREVADARGDEFLAECAVWQLGALRWEQEAQAQLEQSRRLRQPR